MNSVSYLDTQDINLRKLTHSELIRLHEEIVEMDCLKGHNKFTIINYDYHKDKQLIENEFIRRMVKGDKARAEG